LLDGDYALNNANWMWLSASAFFTQYFRVYSPVAFGKKTDKNGDFIRHWIPVLKNMPAKFIYEPWCIVGVDYPRPIVDHKKASADNMAKMKAAYARGRESSLPEKHAKKRKT
jgi:cryptochrome